MRWLRNLLFRRRRERDLDDELASFLERFVEAIDEMVATTEECKTDGS